MVKAGLIFIIALMVSGCVARPPAPDCSAIMLPPFPRMHLPAESMTQADTQESSDTQESTDIPRTLKLDWQIPIDARAGDRYVIYFSPLENNLETWAVMTNIAWPSNSITLPASNGFYRIKVRTAARIESK